MNSFRLSYNKTSTIVLAMVAIPIVSIVLLFAFLFSLPKSTPDWLIIFIICNYLVLLVVTVLYVVNKKATIPCKVVANESGISFKFERNSFLYKVENFYSGWENVTNISENFYNGQANFYRITFSNPNFTANFSAIKGEESDAEKFYDELIYYQELYNLNHLSTPIRSKNFYETFWTRAITWLFYTMSIVLTILHFILGKEMDWYKTISLFCFGSIWIGNYYRNTKKLY